MTYEEADALLQGRNEHSRKVGNNTYLRRRGEDIALQLHATDVLTFHRDGSVTLDNGGWKTKTTKERIHDYLPKPYGLQQIKGAWYVFEYVWKAYTYGDGEGWHYPDSPNLLPFENGMTLPAKEVEPA